MYFFLHFKWRKISPQHPYLVLMMSEGPSIRGKEVCRDRSSSTEEPAKLGDWVRKTALLSPLDLKEQLILAVLVQPNCKGGLLGLLTFSFRLRSHLAFWDLGQHCCDSVCDLKKHCNHKPHVQVPNGTLNAVRFCHDKPCGKPLLANFVIQKKLSMLRFTAIAVQ